MNTPFKWLNFMAYNSISLSCCKDKLVKQGVLQRSTGMRELSEEGPVWGALFSCTLDDKVGK
jgi:hypothetical protein